jgi:hypothetical protein
MKRNGDIASLFEKLAAKKLAASLSPSPAPATTTVEEQETVMEEIEAVLPPPLATATPVYDISRLPHDLGERLPIASYPVNDQDAIRRAYILKGPFKPYAHEYAKRKIGTRDRSCSIVWLYKYNWAEYSIKKDAVFCFFCYLFKVKNSKGKGSNAFTVQG